jgi:hypothetical protein
MTITFEMTGKDETVHDIANAACSAAYEAGKRGDELTYCGSSGCQEKKNFYMVLEINECV